MLLNGLHRPAAGLNRQITRFSTSLHSRRFFTFPPPGRAARSKFWAPCPTPPFASEKQFDGRLAPLRRLPVHSSGEQGRPTSSSRLQHGASPSPACASIPMPSADAERCGRTGCRRPETRVCWLSNQYRRERRREATQVAQLASISGTGAGDDVLRMRTAVHRIVFERPPKSRGLCISSGAVDSSASGTKGRGAQGFAAARTIAILLVAGARRLANRRLSGGTTLR